MCICVFVHAYYILTYNLLSLHNVTCMHVFTADHLVWTMDWSALSWREPPLPSQLSLVALSSLCRIEALWPLPIQFGKFVAILLAELPLGGHVGC